MTTVKMAIPHDFILGAADGKLTPAVEGRDDQNMTGENNG